MKKYIFTIISFMFSVQTWGQIEYSNIKAQADDWYRSVTSSDASYNQGKHKTIEFTEYGYCIVGSFAKGQLCEGQIAEFYDTSLAMPELLLSGMVHYIANRTTIHGFMNVNSEYGTCSIYGTFIVSNTPDRHMTCKVKNGGQLSITCSEAEYYMGYIHNCPTAVKIKGEPAIAVYAPGFNHSYNDYYAPLKEQHIIDYGYSDLTSLLLSSGNNARVHWQQGQYTDFKGKVIPEINADKTLNFILLEGEKSSSSNANESIRVYEDAGKLCMEIYHAPTSQVKKEVIIVKDKLLIDKHSYWDIKKFLSNMSEIQWSLRNGDSYIGNASFEVNTSNNDQSETITERLTTGVYRYANGDYFEGDLSKGYYCGFPIYGTMYFKDGSSTDGGWLKEYNLTESQCEHLCTKRFPSDVRNSAKVFYNDNLYLNSMEEAKKAKEEMRYEEAKEHYLVAKNLRPDAEAWDEIIDEIDKLIEENSFRKEMIEKYGDYYGPMIAEGNIEIGMSKSMVNDAFSTDPVLPLIYKISNTKDSANNVHEIWEYDYNQFEKYLKENAGVEEFAYNILNKLGSSFGLDLRTEFDRVVKYRHLDFKNDVLVDLKVKQTSELDDQLHDAMWLMNMVSRFF